jgi:uncharacterized protein YhaN
MYAQTIDGIINNLNRLNVQGIQNMSIVLDAVSKLAALKDGVQKALDEKDKKIEALKENLNALNGNMNALNGEG